MSDDIFREVEEDVRRERLERIWKDYGDYIIAGASLLVIAAAGYRLWLFYDARERAKAANEYAVAQQLLDNGQSQAAAESFGRLAESAPKGYAKISQLQEADALLAAGNKSDAVNLYKKLMDDSDPILSAVARIRLAWATVDDSSRTDIANLLAPVAAASSPWHSPAGEVLAYADYRGGAIKVAIAEYKHVAGDTNAPPGVRERSHAMAVFLDAGGERNAGTVPMPAPAAPAAAAPAPASNTTQPANHAAPAAAKPAPTQPAKPQGSAPK
ncbi:MAG TPA: tetratricopeptide repeat protein [Rhizomicrobium sp.]